MSDEAAATEPAEPNAAQAQQPTEETPPDPNPVPAPARHRLKYKADGKEIEEELDEAELGRRLSAAHGLHRKFREFGKKEEALRKQAEALRNGDPEAWKAFGVDPRELLQRQVLELAKREAMTPEERKEAELRAREEAANKRDEDWRTQREREAHNAAVERTASMLRASVPEAMKAAGLPESPAAQNAMLRELEALAAHLEATGEPLTAEHVRAAALVAKDGLHGDVAATVKALPPGAAYDLLGQQFVRALFGEELRRLEAGKKPGAAPAAPAPHRPAPEKKTEPHFVLARDLYSSKAG